MRKKILLSLISTCLLTSCISLSDPIYVHRIDVYRDDTLLTGTLKYHDGSSWMFYNANINKKRTNVYHSVDVRPGETLNIKFFIFSSDTIINEMKLTFSRDFISETLDSDWATVFEPEDDITITEYNIDNFSSIHNVIQIYGWLTNNGPKYAGALTRNTNYSLRGVHFNIIRE